MLEQHIQKLVMLLATPEQCITSIQHSQGNLDLVMRCYTENKTIRYLVGVTTPLLDDPTTDLYLVTVFGDSLADALTDLEKSIRMQIS